MLKLRNLALLLCLVISSAVNAQIDISEFDVPSTHNFNSLAGTGTLNDISTLPPGWLFAETGTAANLSYAAGSGTSTTGNTYSFGSSPAERAFGGLQSGTLVPTIGASFVNNTGETITRLSITYRGEQWRLGNLARIDKLDFQYAIDPNSLLGGTWVDVDPLDFEAPVNLGIIGALNGNLAANNTLITYEFSGIEVPPGVEFYIRFVDFNATGADDGLAIDDFSITAVSVVEVPAITFTPPSFAFGDVNAGETKIGVYEVTGENLSAPISIAVTNSVFAISTDSISFSSSATLPDTGGFVYVRFSPLVNGLQEDLFEHTSDATSAMYSVSGNGFVQAENIIPIAVARPKPLGTKVTVAGRITVGNELGNPAYIQDDSGGIPVFDFALANGVEIGDSVIVTGPIGIFNEQRQISGPGIFFTKVVTEKRFITPKPISVADLAANEGLLVTVQGVELVNKSFVFYPQSTEQITDGTSTADLRIDGDTNIPGLAKPQFSVDITGVVGRFQANAQLLPRFEQDIPGATEPTTPVDGISKNKTFDVVTWNFEFFGAASEDYGGEEFGPADEQLQLENIKKVLDSLQADIIAVEEVSDEALFTSLVSQLGGTYSSTCSDRYSHSFEGPSDEFPPQKVCFIYNTSTVNVLSTRVMFEDLYDEARTSNPLLLPAYPGGDPSNFYASGRLPYLLTAAVTIEGVTETVSLIAVHAKSGATAIDRLRRLYDATVLKDSLDAHLPDASLIFLGDLNDDLDLSIFAGLTSPYLGFVIDTHYEAVTKALSDAGARSTVSFDDVIDHQIITNVLQDVYLDGSAQIIAPFSFIENYGTTTTDHLPVMTRYLFEAPSASFTQTGVVLSEDSTTYLVSITLSKPVMTDRQLTVNLSGDANYTQDFITLPAAIGGAITLSLPAGSDSASFIITVVNDVDDEVTETAVFELQATGGIETEEPSTFTLTLEDNDIPTIAFKEILACAEEGSGAYAVKFKLSGAVATDQTVTIYVFDKFGLNYGTDYITEPAVVCNTITVNIPAGSSQVSFDVIPLTDNKNEKFSIEIIAFYLAETSDGLIDVNPRLSLFNIIDVRQPPHFVVFPNPTSGPIELSAAELDDNDLVLAELRNEQGWLVFLGMDDMEGLSEKISNKLNHGNRGIYTLHLLYDGERYQIRIVKE